MPENSNSKHCEVTMPSFRFRALLAWLVILILAAPVPAQTLSKVRPEDAGFSTERLQRLTDAFQAYVADGKKRRAGELFRWDRWWEVPQVLESSHVKTEYRH
jgi:hypothetical protein